MKKQDEKLIIGAGVLLIAYFGIIRPVLTKVGIFKSAEEKAKQKRDTQLIEAQVQASAKNEKPTKSETEWNVIAQQIYEDLRYSAVSDNKADAGYQVARVKNDADFWLLYKSFDKRQEYAFGLPVGAEKDLSQFIRDNLSSSAISTINDNYRRKNIKFRF
jgi:hypothetical protein